MSAGVFPPTSSRSTRPRTSTRAPEFAGYSGLHEAVPQRIGPGISATAAGPAGSHRWFPEGSGGSGFRPPGASRVRMGGLTVRGQRCVCLPGELTFSSKPALALPKPALGFSPKPTPYVSPKPAPYVSPKPTLGVRAPRFSTPAPPRRFRAPRMRSHVSPVLSHAPPACSRAGRKHAFACGVPGALRGTWVSPTRFDEDERPVSRERLDMRGTYSHEASSWARGYYAE